MSALKTRSTLGYRSSFATLLTIGLVSFAPSAFAGVCYDTDEDGICDKQDNCIEVPNFGQLNTNKGRPNAQHPDRDFIGNACDADYNNDGEVDDLDADIFAEAFGAIVGDEEFAPDCDADGDGVVGGRDWEVLRNSYGQQPGPSAK